MSTVIDTTALIVEDTSIGQKMAKLYLSQIFPKVDIASNASEAITMVKDGNYGIIFMDIGLPDMSGIEATEYIRKQLQLTDLPIVALTANYDDSCAKEFARVGIKDVLKKPLNLESARNLVNKLFERSK